MESIYPAGPSAVRERLTEPSARYKRSAWLAMAGLLTFIVAYFGLMAWFAATAWRLFAGMVHSGDDVFFRIIGSLCAAFLAVFMLKAVVFVKRHKSDTRDVELKAADQPELFAFLHRLADEAGAPRPHRVFLSPRVNAAVFYDLSLVNLILPSRKNLEIGMGLMNVLNLGEFKAVLAHEFGHFAQRTMAVGRWVYVAQQIAAHIISRRDALDTMLSALSRFDFRIAWIGWLLQLIVWSIRSLVELLFRVVVLAERGLSREMEYQADLVAASLTGSDALVHALHRLGAADEAFDRSLRFASSQLAQERPVQDMFAIQTRMLDHLRAIYADPGYGQSPVVPGAAPEAHRVFGKAMARPPQMWATHPANADREENIKRHYLPAGIDERSALVLLRDADALRAKVTQNMLGDPRNAHAPVPLEQSLAALDQEFSKRALDQRYRGTYLGRAPFREHEAPGDLYGSVGVVTDLRAEIEALYPAEHGERLEQLRELEQARGTMQAVRDGYLMPSGGVVHWRGAGVSRRDLPGVLAQIAREAQDLKTRVLEHDRRCRQLHLLAAGRAGPGWEDYLRGLVALLHFAEHSEANVRDSHGLLINTYNIVTADRRVSAGEVRRLVAVANDLHRTMSAVFDCGRRIALDERTAARLGVASVGEMMGSFHFSPPTENSIGQWLSIVDSWVNATTGPLVALRSAALETLLEAEDEVRRGLADASGVTPAPAAARVPYEYPTLLPGKERKLQNRLGWWDRFQTAQGAVPTLARLAAAGGIVGAVVLAGSVMGKTELVVFNGLATPVKVEVDGQTIEVPAGDHVGVTLEGDGNHLVMASTPSGERIERFNEKTDNGGTYVYNVARAAALVEWSAVYGDVPQPKERKLGTRRWLDTSADFVLVDPPKQIQTKGQGGSRRVLSAFSDPGGVSGLASESEVAEATAAHVQWDPAGSPKLAMWMYQGMKTPAFAQALEQRLARDPHEVLSLRMQQDATTGAAHDAVCQAHRERAQREAGNANLQYVALRCLPHGPAQDEAFVQAHRQWPDNAWLQLAVGYVEAERQHWPTASVLMQDAMSQLPEAADWLALDAARVARMQHGPAAPLAALSRRSDMLAQQIMIEAGSDAGEASMGAFVALSKGQLGASLEQAQGSPVETMVSWLAAASDGASSEMAHRIASQPLSEELDDSTAFIAMALAARERVDLSAIEARVAKIEGDDTQPMLAFFRQVRAGAGQASAEAALGAVGPRARGHAYAMAAVYLREDCPAAWREGARRLLFPTERPFLGS